MKISKKSLTLGASMALIAATMATVPSFAVAGSNAETASVHCFGVNQCKGHNDCKTANNACKGMGSCKGQGFVAMSKSTCDNLGGKVK
jgi:uncharacterized membrane protein